MFEQALQLRPDNVKFINKYANVLIEIGKIEESLLYLEKALQLEPDNVTTITNYANALIKLSRAE